MRRLWLLLRHLPHRRALDAAVRRHPAACQHRILRSTLLWPPEANTVICEDCGTVISAPTRNETR